MRLPRLRAAAEDLLDVGPEPDVQHAVGLVEDDEPQFAQHQRPAAHQVEHAAGRSDDQGGALVELLDLLADGFAAVEGHDVDMSALGQLGALVANLDGQFPRRHQHQGLRRGGLAVGFDLFEDGDGEGGRLAGPGLGLAHHVHARHRPGNQARLNGRRLQVACAAQAT